MTTLTLTPVQVQLIRGGRTTIDLTAAQVAAISGGGSVPTTPPTTPPTIPSGYVVIPSEVANRNAVKVVLPWTNGAPRIIADLDDSNMWVLAFTPGTYRTARFAGGEWQAQPCARNVVLIHNRDGATIARLSGIQTPSLNLVPGVPTFRSGKYQAEAGEAYTLVIWNVAPTPAGSGRMFLELYVQ